MENKSDNDTNCSGLIFSDRFPFKNGFYGLKLTLLSGFQIMKSFELGTSECIVPLKLILSTLIVGYHQTFRHNELVHLPYIAGATNTSGLEGEEPLLITEANTIVGLYPYSLFTDPMFLFY